MITNLIIFEEPVSSGWFWLVIILLAVLLWLKLVSVMSKKENFNTPTEDKDLKKKQEEDLARGYAFDDNNLFFSCHNEKVRIRMETKSKDKLLLSFSIPLTGSECANFILNHAINGLVLAKLINPYQLMIKRSPAVYREEFNDAIIKLVIQTLDQRYDAMNQRIIIISHLTSSSQFGISIIGSNLLRAQYGFMPTIEKIDGVKVQSTNREELTLIIDGPRRLEIIKEIQRILAEYFIGGVAFFNKSK